MNGIVSNSRGKSEVWIQKIIEKEGIGLSPVQEIPVERVMMGKVVQSENRETTESHRWRTAMKVARSGQVLQSGEMNDLKK